MAAAPEKNRSEFPTDDPDALARALDSEMKQQRLRWEQARRRRGAWRALSFLFLLLVIVGALLVWFYLLPAVKERESAPGSTPAAAESR